MSSKNKYNLLGPDTNMGVFKYTHRLSYAKKKSNDFRWVEEMADYYDFYYSQNYHEERRKRLKINYDLYNGRAPDLNDYADKYHNHNYSYTGENGHHEVVVGYENIEHHPIIDQVAKAMVGEQRKRPLNPVAKDISRYSTNQRKRKKLELLQEYIQSSIVGPIEQQIQQNYFKENGIEDPYSLDAEQQQQMQADIASRIEAKTPSEIKTYMMKDYKSPSEVQAQRIIDYLMQELKIKDLTDEGFKHAIITAMEVYKVGIRNQKPYVDLVNPDGFNYYGSPNSTYIQDGQWATYEQTITHGEFFNNFAMELEPRHLKLLDNLFSGLSSSQTTNYSHAVKSDLVSVVANNSELQDPNIDIRNQQGQQWMKDLYKKYGSLSHYDLRHVHIAYRSLRKMYHVERFDQTTGLLKHFWFDEAYTPDRLKGDLSWKIYWVPQVWECDKIGYLDSLYLNKRPVPGQYRSIEDPFDVNLPYVGVEYNKLMKNTKNVSVIDLGKPWQYKFNVQMARLQEMEATDLGNVLLTTLQAKPKDWTWQEFFNHIKYSKAVILDLQQEGVGPAEAQFFKNIDLSNSQDISSKVAYMEFIKQNIATSMYYNPSRLGQIDAHTAVTNNQQNIIQSSNQTEDLYSTHNAVVESMLNALIDTARVAYKDNPQHISYVLDDMSIADFELDSEMLWMSKMGVFLRNQSEDFHNMQVAKDLLPFMIQNQMMSYPQAMQALWAQNGAELMNLAQRAQNELDEKMLEQQQHEQQLGEQQKELQQQMFQMDAQLKLLMQERDNLAKLKMAEIGAMENANMMDIDQNKISDAYEQALKKIEYERERDNKDRELEREKLREEMRMKLKDIEVKKIQAKKSASTPTKK